MPFQESELQYQTCIFHKIMELFIEYRWISVVRALRLLDKNMTVEMLDRGNEIKATCLICRISNLLGNQVFKVQNWHLLEFSPFERSVVKNFEAVLRSTERFVKGFAFLLLCISFRSAPLTRRKEKLGLRSNRWRSFLDRVRDQLALLNHHTPLHHKYQRKHSKEQPVVSNIRQQLLYHPPPQL